MWEIENGLIEQGITAICGVDEAGRGPLAGPVCAAAVILPPHAEIPGLNDSKKLSDKRRRELFPVIKEQAIAYGIGIATHEEIDEINILQATFLASCRQGIFFLPTVFVLPLLLDLTGVQATQSLADICTFFISIPFIIIFYKKYIVGKDNTK